MTSFLFLFVVLRFVSAFLREARQIADQQGFVGVCVVNNGFVNLTKSWLCNVAPFDSHPYVLLVATDRQAFDELAKFRRLRQMKFVLALHRIDDRTLATSLAITQRSYWQWLVFRVDLLRTLIEHSIDVLLFETDAVWFKCAFEIWRKERRASTAIVDISGVADGSAARQMGFGFLRIRANERTKTLWNTLHSRFRDAVAKLRVDKDSARVQSEQAILNELLKSSPNIVSSILPRSEYVDGSFYRDHVRRHSCPTPVLINNNFIIGVDAKIERARRWKHFFLDDRDAMTCLDATSLSQTLGGWEPREFFSVIELHWRGCYPPYPDSEQWCRCCQNDAMHFRNDCVKNGFCTSRCLKFGTDYCTDQRLWDNAALNCSNRYVFFGKDFDLRRALSISAVLQRTILLSDEQSKHRIAERFCYLSLREFRDLLVQRYHVGIVDTNPSRHSTPHCDVFCNHDVAFNENANAANADFTQNILSILKMRDVMILVIK